MTWLALGGVAILVLDQLSKRAIARRLAENEIGWRASIVSIRRVTAMTGACRWSRLVAVWAVAVVGTVLYASVAVSAGVLVPLALGAAIGGASSNLFDRLWRGFVVDFIAVGFWPTFNLADAAIVGGVLLAVCTAG
jgi:signal peptidase II